MWAGSWSRTPFRHHYESRARSVPPEPASTTTAPYIAGPPLPPTSTTTTTTAGLAPLQAFQRFEQACQRLRWKYVDLQSSYGRAMGPEEAGFTAADAERNFKVDFYEFYAWIEQALVLVLHVFGVAVPRGGGRGGATGMPTANGGGGSSSTSAAHAFHHNVLSALGGEAAGPLREALGTGETNQALWKAKELRNRWKDAAEGRETPPLKMYDLRWIVGTVLAGLEAAYVMAARRMAEEVEEEVAARAAAGGVEGETGMAAAAQGEEGWEWMVDSMDWEA